MTTAWLWLFLQLLPLNLWTLVQGAGQFEYYQLIDDLFTDYKAEIRPTVNGEETRLYLRFDLLSIQSLDEKNQVLEVHASIVLVWDDLYLSWDPANYGNITHFLYPQKKLWLPDLICQNSVESQSQLGYNEMKCSVSSDGSVMWYPSEIFKTDCSIDVSFYPFDTQKCSIVFSTWLSTSEDIDILLDNATAISLGEYNPSGTWDLLETTAEKLPNDNDVTKIQITLTMKRRRTYYVLNILLPVIFLSFVASMVFILPADAGEKIGMSMTVLLAFAVYLTVISDNMPQTSLQVSYISVYISLLLGITALGVLLSVIVLYLHHKSEDLPISPKTESWTRWVRRFFRLTVIPVTRGNKVSPLDVKATFSSKRENVKAALTSDVANEKLPENDETLLSEVKKRPFTAMTMKSTIDLEQEEITWVKVAEALDRIFFTLFSLIVILSTIIIMLSLVLGD